MGKLKKILKDMQEYVKRGNVVRRYENKLDNLLLEREKSIRELGKQFSSKLKDKRFIDREIKRCLKKINMSDAKMLENTKTLNRLEREKKDLDVAYKEKKVKQKEDYVNLTKEKELLTDKYIELKKRLAQKNKEFRKQRKGILDTLHLSQNESQNEVEVKKELTNKGIGYQELESMDKDIVSASDSLLTESEVGALQGDIEALNMSLEKLKSDTKVLERDNIENNDKLNASIRELKGKQQIIESQKDVEYIELGKLTLSKRTRDKNIVKTKKRLQVIDKLKLELENIIKNGKMILESHEIRRAKWLILAVVILGMGLILGVIYLLVFSNILL